MLAKNRTNISRLLLNYLLILVVGVLIGYRLGKSVSAPEASSPVILDYQSLTQTSELLRLSASGDNRSTQKNISDSSDQNDPSTFSVPLGFFKNVGYSGILLHEGKFRIDDGLMKILGITEGEAAEICDHFNPVLASVREYQVQATQVILNDPDGGTVIEVAAPSEEQSQLWLDEIHNVCHEILGDVRGTQFEQIISYELAPSLAYSAMTITAQPSGEGSFDFTIESGNGASRYGSTTVPAEIAHLMELGE